LQEEIARLKAQLAARQGTEGAAGAAEVQVSQTATACEPAAIAVVGMCYTPGCTTAASQRLMHQTNNMHLDMANKRRHLQAQHVSCVHHSGAFSSKDALSCFRVQVVERVVEVEPDKAALVEQLRAQMKAEMEAQQEQQLQGQALEAARQEAEARARQQLEVSVVVKAAAVQVHACARQQPGQTGIGSC
jgi:hypothetical protein